MAGLAWVTLLLTVAAPLTRRSSLLYQSLAMLLMLPRARARFLQLCWIPWLSLSEESPLWGVSPSLLHSPAPNTPSQGEHSCSWQESALTCQGPAGTGKSGNARPCLSEGSEIIYRRAPNTSPNVLEVFLCWPALSLKLLKAGFMV